MRENDLIRVHWDGECLVPDRPSDKAQVEERFGQGEVFPVDLDPKRSTRTHNHYFAIIKNAWDNLPERLANEPFARSTETLRKHALISRNYCDIDTIAIGEEIQAARVAGEMRKISRRAENYQVISTQGTVIHVFTAKTQRVNVMGRTEFNKSKTAVIEWLADLIGTTPEKLASTAKEAA